jgi:hypothetical protein
MIELRGRPPLHALVRPHVRLCDPRCDQPPAVVPRHIVALGARRVGVPLGIESAAIQRPAEAQWEVFAHNDKLAETAAALHTETAKW